MSVSETFDRKFNKCMRGYNPEEVDGAIDALLRYCDDLEAANREFEIANNDLIDEKTRLEQCISKAEEEKDSLRAELRTMADECSKIESVYNDYRARFGEARDLVINAKNAAAEITQKASESANALIKDAERRSEEEKAKLATDIAYRKKLADGLTAAYDEFKTRIAAELGEMLAEISNFSLKPDVPDIPDEVLKGAVNAAPPPSIDDVKSNEAPTESAETTPADEPNEPEIYEVEQETNATQSNISESNAPEQSETDGGRFYADINNIWKENSRDISSGAPENTSFENRKPSPLDEIKSSVERINSKVIEKKSTPHI